MSGADVHDDKVDNSCRRDVEAATESRLEFDDAALLGEDRTGQQRPAAIGADGRSAAGDRGACDRKR